MVPFLRIVFALLLTCLVSMIVVISAWSLLPPTRTSNNNNSRRAFLEKGAFATAVVATAPILLLPVNAAAVPATKNNKKNKNKNIYKPPPNSLNDKIIVITGASTGLGLESAKRLAAAGATIILTTRTDAKGVKAVEEVQSYLQQEQQSNNNGYSFSNKIYALTLDLDNLSSIRSFPQRFERKMGVDAKINVLMNNAGVAAIPTRQMTRDGFERTFQSNHLGPFLLTALLFPYLNRTAGSGAKVISVSSTAHMFATTTTGSRGLNLNNLNSELEYNADGWQSYGQSKLENILFTQELQRRADNLGMDWLSTSSLHPGVVGTDIWRTSFARQGGSDNPLQTLSSKVFYNSILTTEEGANTQVRLAAEGTSKGQYWDEKGKLHKLEGFAKDPKVAKKLWEQSEEFLGVQFELK